MNATLILAACVVAAGCSDKGGGRSPTETNVVGVPPGVSLAKDFDNGGSGSNFKLFGDARLTRDPENPTNVVLQVVNDGGTPAGAYRRFNHVQVWQLDHQLNFKYAFVAPHTCGGGSPRIILLIDANGDGKFQTAPEGPDFAANGHVNPPAFAGCPTSIATANNGGAAPSTLLWRFEDLTDELTRWEITGGVVPNFPPYPGPNWDAFEQVISTAFPNHQVLEAIFLEDFNPTPGVAYYDLITAYDLTLGTRGQVSPERGNKDDDLD
jgi:hypothetical protein